MYIQPKDFLAHRGQSVEEHLLGVAALAKQHASKLDLADVGELLGLLHDVGKYTEEFRCYILSSLGILNPDIDEDWVDAKALKGKIDHSTAGAQLLLIKTKKLWKKEKEKHRKGLLSYINQVLSLCLVSHHSGLIDNLCRTDEGVQNNYKRRITKSSDLTRIDEVTTNINQAIDERINSILKGGEVIQPINKIIKHIESKEHNITLQVFQLGMVARFLLSCLLDADRQDSADCENEIIKYSRLNKSYVSFDTLSKRLEDYLAPLQQEKKTSEKELSKLSQEEKERIVREEKVNKARRKVSNAAYNASFRKRGIYTLTAKTGLGKSFALLRFGVNHAKKHNMDRIIVVAPFTTIIDQNAEIAKAVLTRNSKERIVIEHHYNIEQEKQTWKEKLLTENWDAPVIYTTLVQFLDTVASYHTRNTRRMHQLANAVIIFDEIQSIPVQCIHLFANSLNFLHEYCKSTVVLCTATQPLLHKINKEFGSLHLSRKHEIISYSSEDLEDLSRIKIINKTKASGWTIDDLMHFVLNERCLEKSCLVIVNKKKTARDLFVALKSLAKSKNDVFHLSTFMDPFHRKDVLNRIKGLYLEHKPTICISTQLVEAGVDLDFDTVIRSIAGLPSILQAAGRCNRHGRNKIGYVYVVNLEDEIGVNISAPGLKDIRLGIDKTLRILEEYNDLSSLEALNFFYKDYFNERQEEMLYKLKDNDIEDDLISMYSTNFRMLGAYQRSNKSWKDESADMILRQAFKSGGRNFHVIPELTKPVITPHTKESMELVKKLSKSDDFKGQRKIMRELQQFSVALYERQLDKLKLHDKVKLIREDMNLYYLDPKQYNKDYGVVIPNDDED